MNKELAILTISIIESCVCNIYLIQNFEGKYELCSLNQMHLLYFLYGIL